MWVDRGQLCTRTSLSLLTPLLHLLLFLHLAFMMAHKRRLEHETSSQLSKRCSFIKDKALSSQSALTKGLDHPRRMLSAGGRVNEQTPTSASLCYHLPSKEGCTNSILEPKDMYIANTIRYQVHTYAVYSSCMWRPGCFPGAWWRGSWHFHVASLHLQSWTSVRST